MGLSFWLQLALAGVIAILGLFRASASQSSVGGTIGFLIFLAAIGYGFYLLKAAFDRIDQGRH